MASMWRRAMLYLGLGPDEEYDDFDVTGEHQRAAAPRPPVRRPPPEAQHDPEPSGSVRTLPPTAGDDLNGHDAGRPSHDAGRANGHERGRPQPSSRVIDRGGSHLEVARAAGRRSSERPPSARNAVVRPLPTGPTKPFVVGPASFNDAQDVADKFKVNVPVILNLQGVERDLARRIIDFASGLCYGLGGQMERVANQIYLLTPSDVEVSPEERRRLHERGYEA
jgi:cell division inhibitor SepF